MKLLDRRDLLIVEQAYPPEQMTLATDSARGKDYRAAFMHAGCGLPG